MGGEGGMLEGVKPGRGRWKRNGRRGKAKGETRERGRKHVGRAEGVAGRQDGRQTREGGK